MKTLGYIEISKDNQDILKFRFKQVIKKNKFNIQDLIDSVDTKIKVNLEDSE